MIVIIRQLCGQKQSLLGESEAELGKELKHCIKEGFLLPWTDVPAEDVTKESYTYFLSGGMNIVNLNYHDQKIRRTPAHGIREHWTGDSTLLGLYSSVYRNLHHWRSNQRPQTAVPKLNN